MRIRYSTIRDLNPFFFWCMHYISKLLKRKTWSSLVFGQRAEDYFFSKLIDVNQKPKYMDIGAYHPIIYSNTYTLYKKGCRGINIDMSDRTIELFNRFRKNDVNICAAISNSDSDLTKAYYMSVDGLSPINTIDEDLANRHAKKFNATLNEKLIKTTTLLKIFSDYEIEPRSIDILNIDVEGLDYEVLSQWPFNIAKPKLICIEMLTNEYEEIKKSKIHALLSQNDYKINYWLMPSIIYVRKFNSSF